jgi:hypothetical protein
MRFAWILAAILAFPLALTADDALPAGTILPVCLERSVNASKAHQGMEIRAKVMQDIPGTSIRRGAEAIGHVVKVNSSSAGQANLVITFDAVKSHGRRIPLKADLRALASFVEVEQAQVPEDMASRGLNEQTWTTEQIGGDQVYRGGGPVEEGSRAVGQPTPYGVLDSPLTQAGEPCRGVMDDANQPQAFWLFSADACGVYGYSHLRIAHSGRTEPVGTIDLVSDRRKLILYGGSGMLLRVQGS